MAESHKKKERRKTAEMATEELPPHLEEMRTRVVVQSKSVDHAAGMDVADAFQSLGVDSSFSMEKFRNNFRIHVISSTEEELVFDMIGVDAPIANAFRRILIAEAPTMAIEKVFITNNTSILQDEVLAHRLGLIPLRVDPRKFDLREVGFLTNILMKKCERNPNGEESGTKPYSNDDVLSQHLLWEPQGNQAEVLALDPPEPVHPDILIAKLRPGQEIDVECHCEKGIGKTHAKWSPVATAAYRLLPAIDIVEEVVGDEARELVAKCPMKVFDIEDIGEGRERAVVVRPRDCSVCRECIRDAKFSRKVKVTRIRNHFIFSIESTGALSPKVLFGEAVKVLIDKCLRIKGQVEDIIAKR